MNTYIAMLRGINVSGQKMIPMADLRTHLSKIGLHEVQTYIQSGNVVFKYATAGGSELEEMIRQMIQDVYGFDVPTLVKTPDEIEAAINNHPWQGDPEKEVKRTYLTFLAAVPDPELVEKLAQTDHRPEEWVLVGKDVYFFSPQSYGRAKMNNNYFEQKLKVAATTRNWNTVNKLLELSR